MEGMAGISGIEQYRRHLTIYVYRLLVGAASVAYVNDRARLGDSIVEHARS